MTSLAQTLSIKKIVSVVFDDSSSMNDVTMKWSYANYAMQAFCGLLNKEDELYITYMSDYVNSKPFDMTKDIQSNVDSIRRHFQGDGTPIESVDTAINRLMSVPESNPNTQYWLVIITDGQFGIYGSGGQQTGTVNSTVLETKISDFVSSKMPNGSNPQVSYFAIGSDAAKLKEDTRNGIFSYSATGADEIVDVMSRIADKISGRIRIPADKMTIADDKTIQITSDLPMLNIAVLSQKTSARVSEVKGTDVTLTLEHSAKLFYPEAQQDLPTDESLKGGTFLFDNGNLNTPADTYTITFTEAVNKDSVVIMYEPAVEMRMKVYSPNGQEIADIKDLFAGDEIDVVCKIYESGTDKEIDPRLLSNGVTYYVSYLEGNELIKEETGSSLSIKGLKLKDIDSELKSAIEIPGFLPMTTSVSFHPAPPVQYTMTVTAPNGDRIRRTELYKNEKGMIFTIFGDGIPLTRKETENLNVHFTMQDPFGSKLELKTALNADGTYTCTPIYTKGWSFPTRGFWNWHVSWPGFGIPAGELRVMSGIGNGTFKDLITGVLLIEREHWRITLINILLPILITLFILGLIFRRRFRRGKKVKSIDVTDDGYSLVSSGPNWSSKKLRSFNIWSLIPWIPSRIKIKGVTFYAKPGGYIGVKIKNIGTKSSKLDGSMIEENKVVNYPSSQINDSFIPGDPKDLRLTKFEEFSTGDVLFNTQNAQNGRLFKFLGGN
jgi:hypothetical protein